MTTSFNAVVKKTGLKDVRFHDLRRTFGSILAQAGVPLFHISKLLRSCRRADNRQNPRSPFLPQIPRKPLTRVSPRIGNCSAPAVFVKLCCVLRLIS
ncbi:MAG: tyrosine-type recombinase/integrase [Deferribacteraceae bacterium]|nr:tyrosine-type recombinase/integrase [Deferribacteraceae bacterium]